LVDDFRSPLDHAFPGPALPLDDDVRRLLIAEQQLVEAASEPERLRHLLLELAQWVVGCDGAILERVDGDDLVWTVATGLLADSVGTRVTRARSLSGLAIATGTPHVSGDVGKDARADSVACRRLGVGSMIAYPLRHAQDTTSVVKVVARTAGALSEREIALLHPLMRMAAARLEAAATTREQHAADKLVVTLGEASRAILTSAEPAAELCQWAGRLADSPMTVFLQPDDDGTLVTVARHGVEIAGFALPPDKPSIMRSAFDTGKLQLIADYRNHPDMSPRVLEILDEGGLGDTQAGAAIPVTSGGQPIGVLAILLRDRITAAHAPLIGLVNVLAAEAGLALERNRLQRQLEVQARSDDLTGMPNRRVWQERLLLEMARATRNQAPLSLAILDLDHFKDFNDSHGHQAGDDMLRAVALAWSTQVRDTDLLARLGGEEFAVLLPDTPLESGQVIATRLLGSVPGGVTASAGLAQWDGEDPEALYRRADQALYAAKAAGRNQLSIADDKADD
jgi:diguanylate cyclase (GGDEF)-like protein